jgi:Amiloride-sensitive sodium channel
MTRQSQKSDDNLRKYPPQSRKCYFEGEKPLKFFKFYTKSNCELECKTEAKFQNCGCVLHSMPRDKSTKICSIDELKCKYDVNLTACECYSSCNDLTYSITSEATRMEETHFAKSKIASKLVE